VCGRVLGLPSFTPTIPFSSPTPPSLLQVPVVLAYLRHGGANEGVTEAKGRRGEGVATAGVDVGVVGIALLACLQRLHKYTHNSLFVHT
jgi:hypothetical protein